MSYVDSNLIPGEEVVYRAKVHWMIYIVPLLLVVVGIWLFAHGAADQANAAWASISGMLLVMIGIAKAVMSFIVTKSTELAVTNKRVIAKFGFIRRNTIELNHSKVESLGVDQGIFDRLLGSGTITIHGTGGVPTPIPNIDDPLLFRKEAMQAFDGAH